MKVIIATLPVVRCVSLVESVAEERRRDPHVMRNGFCEERRIGENDCKISELVLLG